MWTWQRAMTCECGSQAESKNCKILLLPTADRRFDTKVKCPTGRASFWVKFPTVRSLMQVKCPGIARGDGRFWIDWYITISRQDLTTSCTINKVMLYWHCVYLRKIVNVLIVTFILTLSLTNLNFKIEHANISKGKDSNFIYFSASDNTFYMYRYRHVF